MSTVRARRIRWLWSDGLAWLGMAALLCLFTTVITMATWGDGTSREVNLIAFSKTHVAEGNTLRLPGGASSHASARMRLELPASADARQHWLLWVPRNPYDRIWLQISDWKSQEQDFFKPAASDGLLPGAYVFSLPNGQPEYAVVDLHVVGSTVTSVVPLLLREDEVSERIQRTVALNVIVYTGLFTLALVAWALFSASRDRVFLSLFAGALSSGLLFAACNGHVYGLPGLRWMSLWRDQGIWILLLLFLAALLTLLRDYSRLPREGLLARNATWLSIALMVLAALLMMLIGPLIPLAQSLTGLIGLAACVLSVWLLSEAVRQRRPMALSALGLFVLALVAGGLRIAVALGELPDILWTRYGYQLGALCLQGVLALGLIDRIGEYRHQRDRDQRARMETERRMARESARAELTRALQARLRDLAPSDIEWTALRLLLEYLLPQLQATQGAAIVHGYHGRDALVAEPMEDKRRLEQELAKRLPELRRLAMSRQPVQRGVSGGPGRMTELVVPIPVDAHGWGALVLWRDDSEAFDEDEIALAGEFVRLTALHADEAVTNQNLRHTAQIDALTGASNRRSIDQWLARYFREENANARLSLLFVDIDHFKQVNDLYGHACGDHCLRAVADALRSVLRPSDVFGRYGGEEFIALLPDTDATNARVLAERMRAAVENARVEWQGQEHRLTVSIGVATRSSADQGPATLQERADRALYGAKRDGRNRIQVSPATFMTPAR